MDKARLDTIKALKQEGKNKGKAKPFDKMTQKEINELTKIIAKMLGLIE